MAFTTSDNFQSFSYLLYDSHPGQLTVRARNTNGDFFYYNFGRGRHPTPEIGTQAHTDWEILKRDMGIE